MKRFIIFALFVGIGTAVAAPSALTMTVSANVPVTVMGSSSNIASVDPTNLDPNDSNLHAAAVSSAEVSRFYLTLSPFYPVASTATWSLSLSGTAVGHFSLSAGTGIPVTLTTDGTAGTYTSPGTITATANGGANFVYTLPTIVVHSGTLATCGSGSTISTAITTAGAGGVVLLGACTYTGQTFTMKNNQRLQGSGASKTALSGTGVTGAMTVGFDNSVTGVTVDSVAVSGYASIAAATCSAGPPTGAAIETGDGWVIENSSFASSGCDGIFGEWGSAGVTIVNNVITNPQRAGVLCFSGQAGNTGTFTVKGNEISGANQGNFTGGVSAGVKCFAGTGSFGEAAYNINNNYVHDSFPTTAVGGDDSSGIWFDTVHNSTKLFTISGNTILNNNRSGISDEVSCNGDISHNFIKGNTGTVASGTNSRGIILRQNGPVNVHNNNVSVPASGTSYSAIEFSPQQTRTSDACSQGINVKMYLNSITFLDTSSYAGFPVQYGNIIFDSTSEAGMSVCSGTVACGGPNNFHDPNNSTRTSITRYTWYASPGSSPVRTFSSYQSASGQDTTSTLDGNDGTVGITGCLHIACTGAGI